jgi:hypothetical protein
MQTVMRHAMNSLVKIELTKIIKYLIIFNQKQKMNKRKKILILSILIGLISSAVYLNFIKKIETGFSCINCDFYTYRNDWYNDFVNKMPSWDGMYPYPDGFYTFEEMKQRFYFTLGLKILFVGTSSSVLMFYLLRKLQHK